MRTYTADPTAARQANANNYIDQTGKYVGEFTLAEVVTSKKGTEGIEFSFKSQDGQQANYLTLWTHNERGESLYGYKILSAIMTVMGVGEIVPKTGNIKDKDGNPRQVTAFPALHGKPVGLLLQKEFYIKRDGSEGYKFNIHAPFQAGTDLTAKEILDGAKEARSLFSMVASLKDKRAPASTQAQPRNDYEAAKNGSYDDPFGDDFGAGH